MGKGVRHHPPRAQIAGNETCPGSHAASAALRRRILEIRAQNEQTIDRHSIDG
jgi:hypothetical protein